MEMILDQPSNSVQYCSSCGWNHENLEIQQKDQEIFYICILTLQKVIIGGS